MPTPSIVRISAPSWTRFIFVIQDLISLPFMMTEQAPHCPLPHPILVPVRPSCSRITSASEASGSATTILLIPLRFTFLLIIPASFLMVKI